MVELAAIYAHVPKKLNNDGPSKKKESWVKKLEVALRTAMTEDKAGRLTGAKARSPAYKGVDPPFASRETMFERGSVVVGDATGKRDSWKNIKGDSQKIKVMLASTLAGASGPSVAAEEARRERNLTIESSSLSGADKQSMKDKLSIQFAQRSRSGNLSGKFQGPASDMGGGVVNPVLARALAREGGQQQASRFGSGGSGKLDRSKLSSIEALFQKQAPPKRLGPADSSPSAATSAAAPLEDTTPTISRPSRGSVFDHAEIHPTPNLPSGQARSASYGSAAAGDGDAFGAFGGQHEDITDFVPNPIRSAKFSAAPPAAAAADSTSAGSKTARPNVSSALEALFDKRKATAEQQDNKDL